MEVNVHEAKTNLSKLLQRVQEGEEVVIAKAGKPIARLTRIQSKSSPRKIGSAAGEFVVPPDFDEPLPESVLDGFEA